MPRNVDPDVRKVEITAAAWRLIAEDGFDALTIRRLAAELGGATGRVTHYFSSKDEILIAVLQHLTASHASGLQSLQETLTEAGADTKRAAAALVDALPLDEARRQDWKVWLAFWNRALTSRAVAKQHRTTYQQWRTVLAEAIVGLSPSHTDPARVQRSSEHLLACIDGLGTHLLIEPDRADRIELEAIMHRHLRDAVADCAA